MGVPTDEILYSEIFHSIQGEGSHLGKNTIWLRLWGCNLQCSGFGQQDPTKPEKYILPYKELNISKYSQVEQLPVFQYGCDSSYSWSAIFKHLQHKKTPSQIADEFEKILKTSSNPEGKFIHPNKNDIHLCFTGGEPLLPHNQKAIVSVLEELKNRHNHPLNITIETNGTQLLVEEQLLGGDFLFVCFLSVSPKLWTTAGEKPDKALNYQALDQYYRLGFDGQFKFVCNSSKQSWDEVDSIVTKLNDLGLQEWPKFIMKVGARETELQYREAEFVEQCLERGYHYSPRVHVNIWGNTIGK